MGRETPFIRLELTGMARDSCWEPLQRGVGGGQIQTDISTLRNSIFVSTYLIL